MSGGRCVGLIVNPMAGLGGPAGLHGSDDLDLAGLRQAGVASSSVDRARRFLAAVEQAAAPGVRWLTAPGELGAMVLAGRSPTVLDLPVTGTALDTVAAVDRMCGAGTDLVVFVGGDGTARDVAGALSDRAPMLGVPAGVKMQSSVFARTPEAAGAVLTGWLRGDGRTTAAEIVDLDEAARRRGIVGSRLYAVVRTPCAPRLLQSRKIGSGASDETDFDGMADQCRRQLRPDRLWLLGPGTTVAGTAERLGLSGSLLGVDIADHTGVLVSDATAAQIADAGYGRRVQVLLSPVGGQGFLLGRGNQQIAAGLGEGLGGAELIVVAAERKLAEFGGRLYADVGRPAPTSFVRVITGRHSTAMVSVNWE